MIHTNMGPFISLHNISGLERNLMQSSISGISSRVHSLQSLYEQKRQPLIMLMDVDGSHLLIR